MSWYKPMGCGSRHAGWLGILHAGPINNFAYFRRATNTAGFASLGCDTRLATKFPFSSLNRTTVDTPAFTIGFSETDFPPTSTCIGYSNDLPCSATATVNRRTEPVCCMACPTSESVAESGNSTINNALLASPEAIACTESVCFVVERGHLPLGQFEGVVV